MHAELSYIYKKTFSHEGPQSGGGGGGGGGYIQRIAARAEATQRAWVTLLGAWGGSVGYQGGRNERSHLGGGQGNGALCWETLSGAPRTMDATPRIFRLDGDASLKAKLAPFCPQGNVGKALAKHRSGLAVDVGAYDGADTISYATAGHEVFSFEASPRKALGIMKLVNASGVAKRVSFWSAALSDHEGTTSFWQFPTAGHSLERGSERDSIASGPDLPAVRLKQNTTGLSKLQQKKMRLLTPKHVTVPLLTLDGVMGSRTALFVKIDAQGHDGLVILGARALISERRAHILRFELSPFLAPKQAASYMPAIELQLVQSGKAAGEATPRPSPSGRLRV